MSCVCVRRLARCLYFAYPFLARCSPRAAMLCSEIGEAAYVCVRLCTALAGDKGVVCLNTASLLLMPIACRHVRAHVGGFVVALFPPHHFCPSPPPARHRLLRLLRCVLVLTGPAELGVPRHAPELNQLACSAKCSCKHMAALPARCSS